jgi:hypothetical protein
LKITLPHFNSVRGKIAGPGRRYLFANLGDFSPKKVNVGILLKKCKKIGWQHRFHRTSTLQCKVPQNARSGEPYTFYILNIERKNFKILNPAADD